MLVLGLGYKARNGKDTAAKAIAAHYADKYDVRLYSFAAAMKEELNQLDQFELCMRHGVAYDVNPDMTDPLCQTKHGKQSALLQFYGELKRKENPYYWVKALDLRLELEKPTVAIISDLRRFNELLYVKSKKGKTIKVTRMGFEDLSRDPNHISETELAGYQFDYEITVPDSPEGLEELKKDAIILFGMIEEEMQPKMSDFSDVAKVVEVA